MNKQTDLSIKVLLEFAPYIFAVLLVCVIAQTAVGLIPANQANVQIERQPHRAAKLAGPVTWGSPDQPYGKRRPVTDAYRTRAKKPIFSTNFTDPAELQADWNLVSDDNQWGTSNPAAGPVTWRRRAPACD